MIAAAGYYRFTAGHVFKHGYGCPAHLAAFLKKTPHRAGSALTRTRCEEENATLFILGDLNTSLNKTLRIK